MQLSIGTLLFILGTLSCVGITEGREMVKASHSRRGAAGAYVIAQPGTAYSFQSNGNQITISGVPGTAVVSLGSNGQGNAVAIGGRGSAIAVAGNSNGRTFFVSPHGRKFTSSLRIEPLPTKDLDGLHEYFAWLNNFLDVTLLNVESELDGALDTSER